MTREAFVGIKRIAPVLLLIALLCLGMPRLLWAAPAAPPGQPPAGPGGADYTAAGMIETVYGEGSGQFWIFEPDPRPDKAAPVIAFLHGWIAVNPRPYRAWIEHLVKKGNLVIYPRYQEGWREPVENMTPAALGAIRRALQLCDGGRHTAADTARFALAGHSLGGIIGANIADSASREGLPRPGALVVVHPGDSESSRRFGKKIPSILQEDYSGVPADMLFLIIAGEDDHFLEQDTAQKLFVAVSQIPEGNKDYVLVRTDRYGEPDLVADHVAPLAPAAGRSPFRFLQRLRKKRGSVDSLDYYAYWKLLDGLCQAAFYGTDREYALGNTDQQIDMGRWSDGREVKKLLIISE